ncbi:hypothetical protein D9756_006887 [Leucocoprinus leucothites]|uniref:Uncharacterized protein n=1 Tax=Leucocoprinus leucothites TaxID=201217 RepID=A0A8H5D561_9AGAR|nr:hypothetical protein D9756_006887 [Leucoagaricus leucothites]
MPLYYLSIPGTIYIRNFCDRGDEPLYPHTRIDSSIRRIEVTLIPDQPTNIERLVKFTRHVLMHNEHSKSAPFHYIAQIDWSLLQNRHYDINKLIDALSGHHGLVYHLAFTNIVSGSEGFRNAELYITSTGGTGGARLKLPIHAFLDDGLVTYLSSSAGLPSPLTEVCVEDTLPLDETTLSWASRNLVRLLENRAHDIRRATFAITIPHIHTTIPTLYRLYDLTFTQPKVTSPSSSCLSSPITLTPTLEQNILTSLSPLSPSSPSPRPSSASSQISILTLPAHVFASPAIRNEVARLRRLQELKISFTSPLDIPDFGHVPTHRTGDFIHLRCLTFENGTIPQFVSLLPILFPSPFTSPSPRSSTTSPSSSPSRTLHRKFINLTLLISSLSSPMSLPTLVSSINMYIPHGTDIFKLHVKDWGVGEPKGGKWWTKAGVCSPSGVMGGNGKPAGIREGLLKVPGRVMCDLVHPCREEVGCRAKVKKRRSRRSWRKSMTSSTVSTSMFGEKEEERRGNLGSSLKIWVRKWWERWRRPSEPLKTEVLVER